MATSSQAKWGPVKFLGKIYIDRHKGKALDEGLLQRAIQIIKDQAPKRKKLKITVSATERTIHPKTNTPITACLIGADQHGDIQIKTAILNILSLGRIGTVMYYVTAGLETEKHSRYWVRGFSCKSKDHARFICSHIIAICSRVQPGWIPKRGTQLSLVSTDSRVSAATTASGNSEASGNSGTSAETAISGLSAGQEGLPTAAGLQIPQGPPMSVSQHTLEVQQQRQPFGNTSGLQNRMKSDLAERRGALKSVNRGKNATLRRPPQKGQSIVWAHKQPLNTWVGQGENTMMMQSPPPLERGPSLNLDDYLSIM